MNAGVIDYEVYTNADVYTLFNGYDLMVTGFVQGDSIKTEKGADKLEKEVNNLKGIYPDYPDHSFLSQISYNELLDRISDSIYEFKKKTDYQDRILAFRDVSVSVLKLFVCNEADNEFHFYYFIYTREGPEYHRRAADLMFVWISDKEQIVNPYNDYNFKKSGLQNPVEINDIRYFLKHFNAYDVIL